MTGSDELPFHKVYTGMPVYNGEQFLEDSIASNLAQTYDDFGLLISDNASTDRTEEICRDFAASDSRVFYLRNEENRGAPHNYRRCFEPANCEYFRWSNADDLIEPRLLQECVNTLDEHTDVVLVYGKTRLIDGAGDFLQDYDDNLDLTFQSAVDRYLHVRSCIGLSNVLYGLMRREQLAKTGLFGNYTAADINLIAELSLYGRFMELPDRLFSRRMHEGSSSFDRHDKDRQKAFWAPNKNGLHFQAWHRTLAECKAVMRSPLRGDEKRRLYWYLIKKFYWQKSILAKEVMHYCRVGLLKRS